MSTFEPSPDINCPLCNGHGYTLKPKKGIPLPRFALVSQIVRDVKMVWYAR